jgi:hypothetical protein
LGFAAGKGNQAGGFFEAESNLFVTVCRMVTSPQGKIKREENAGIESPLWR